MGRAERLKKLQGPISNRGDLDRVEIAIGETLRLLSVDPRVVAQYTAWCRRRDLPRLMTVQVSDALPGHEAAAWQALISAVTRPPDEAEIATLEHVLAGIGPDRRWPRRFFAKALVEKVFPAAFYNGIQRPELIEPLWITVRDDGVVRVTYGKDRPVNGGYLYRWAMTERGNRPQAIGQQKMRDAVERWYRAHLQDQPVPKPELTKQYAQRTNRDSDAHSAIDDQIKLVETLLNKVLDE
jgi:hypothetical protein